jgi:hypothetical protein
LYFVLEIKSLLGRTFNCLNKRSQIPELIKIFYI